MGPADRRCFSTTRPLTIHHERIAVDAFFCCFTSKLPRFQVLQAVLSLKPRGRPLSATITHTSNSLVFTSPSLSSIADTQGSTNLASRTSVSLTPANRNSCSRESIGAKAGLGIGAAGTATCTLGLVMLLLRTRKQRVQDQQSSLWPPIAQN